MADRLLASSVSLAAIIGGTGGTPIAIKQKARKLLRAAGRAKITGVAATAPTFTMGAAGAASTITTGYGNSGNAAQGGQSHLGNSALLNDLSGVWNPSTFGSGGYYANHVYSGQGPSTNNYRTGANGSGKGFFFDGQVFEVCLNASVSMRLRLTDLSTGIPLWAQAADVVSVTGGISYIKVDLGSRADRIVEVFFADSAKAPRIFGFNFYKTDTVRPIGGVNTSGVNPGLAIFEDDPSAVFIGDSYLTGINNDNLRSSPGYVVSELLGIRNPLVSAYPGTGYLNPNAALTPTSYNFRQRITNGDLDVPRIGAKDLVAFIGSINDATTANAAYTDSALQTEVQATIAAAMAKQPDAIILASGPQFVKNSQTTAARYAAVQAGVVAAAAGDPRVAFLDNSPAGDAWQTGTGKVDAVVGDGSNDYFGAADGVHLNNLGNGNFARRMFLSYRRALTAMAV